MSRWQEKVADWIALIAPALLLVFLGFQDIVLIPSERADPVGGVLWTIAGPLNEEPPHEGELPCCTIPVITSRRPSPRKSG
jgi:hypothetical protein